MKSRGALAFVSFVLALTGRAEEDPAQRHFTDKVKPLLESRCVSCHGPDKVKGGLRLDSRAAALKGGDSGPALTPGKPRESLLLQAVMHSKKDLEMPPKEKLTTNDVAVLHRWILEGAPWPEAATLVSTAVVLDAGERLGDAWSDPRNPIVRIFGGQRLDLWSLQPVSRAEPPPVRNRKRARNEIDRFILSKLEEKKLRPSPEADKRTLARRLSYDLTGLPLTPEEMQEFLEDKRSDAYERLAERLLASTRYGEHQARQWMDVIRYSDSNGFDWDEFRPRAWRFRDYLIRSFNADKPFDQLIREHLAGDELFEGEPKTETEQDYLIATGYLRLGPQDNSAALFNEQPRARAEFMADLVETTGSAFLGLTLSCNRCHDHKYDPLSQADHYRIRAFFEPIKYGDDIPLNLAGEQASIRAHNQSLDEQIKPLEKERDERLEAVKMRLREEKVAKLSDEERALLERPKEQRTGERKAKIETVEKKIEIKDKEVMAALTAEEKERSGALTKQLEALKKQKKSFALGLFATDKPEKVPVTKILFQGDHKAERDAVPPGFISVLDPNPATLIKPVNAKTTGRRLTLANWITSTNHPLTARVFVNRVWQAHFGKGLVATANDFGLAGARPTHPELLDWLARQFMDGGWSIKALHRLIVTSATYRQSSSPALNKSIFSKGPNDRGGPDGTVRTVSQQTDAANSSAGTATSSRDAIDAENALFWRQNLRRLSAEQLRDSLLAVAGTLKLDHPGGPPVWPPLPAEILQANPAFLDDNAEKTKGWYPSPETNRNVRSVYLVQKRTVRLPFMETFDLPENSVSCARRTESIVAPQALTLLNGDESIAAARALARRVEVEAGADPQQQVRRAFALVLQRAPARDESRACRELLEQRSLVEVCRALLNLNEFLFVD